MGKGHDQVPSRDEGLLVGRGHDLAGAKGGNDGSQADHAAGADHDQVDVVTGRQRLERALAPDPLDARREIERGQRALVRQITRDPKASSPISGLPNPITSVLMLLSCISILDLAGDG